MHSSFLCAETVEGETMSRETYIVEISESLVKAVPVEASSEVDAVAEVIRKYKSEDVVLSADDFVEASFSVKRSA